MDRDEPKKMKQKTAADLANGVESKTRDTPSLREVPLQKLPELNASTSLWEELAAAFRNMLRREAAGEKTTLERLVQLPGGIPLSALVTAVALGVAIAAVGLLVKSC